jgi:hypothetical protein
MSSIDETYYGRVGEIIDYITEHTVNKYDNVTTMSIDVARCVYDELLSERHIRPDLIKIDALSGILKVCGIVVTVADDIPIGYRFTFMVLKDGVLSDAVRRDK